jgi:hypothetical protein
MVGRTMSKINMAKKGKREKKEATKQAKSDAIDTVQKRLTD